MKLFPFSRNPAGLKTCVLAAIILVAAGFPLFQKISAQDSPGWSLVEIGVQVGTSLGHVIFGNDGSSLTVTSQAQGFSPEGDELTWVGEQMAGDEASLVVLMTSTTGAGWQGIGMRTSLESHSEGVFLGRNPEGKLIMLGQPDWDWSEETISTDQPLWLKLEKEGSRIRGFYSTDGEEWIQVGTVMLETASGIYAGVAVAGTGNENNPEASAQFAVYETNLGPDEEGSSGTEGGNGGGSENGGGNSPTDSGQGNTGDGTNPGENGSAGGGSEDLPSGSAEGVIYVDNVLGNDAWNGKLKFRKAGLPQGPKRSLEKALEAGVNTTADRIELVIQGGDTPYSWDSLPQTDKLLVILPVGTVILNGQEGSTEEPTNIP